MQQITATVVYSVRVTIDVPDTFSKEDCRSAILEMGDIAIKDACLSSPIIIDCDSDLMLGDDEFGDDE